MSLSSFGIPTEEYLLQIKQLYQDFFDSFTKFVEQDTFRIYNDLCKAIENYAQMHGQILLLGEEIIKGKLSFYLHIYINQNQNNKNALDIFHDNLFEIGLNIIVQKLPRQTILKWDKCPQSLLPLITGINAAQFFFQYKEKCNGAKANYQRYEFLFETPLFYHFVRLNHLGYKIDLTNLKLLPISVVPGKDFIAFLEDQFQAEDEKASPYEALSAITSSVLSIISPKKLVTRMHLKSLLLPTDGQMCQQVLNAFNEKINPNDRDEVGRTALMLAAYYRNPATIVALLVHGANVHLRDTKGSTAIHYTLRYPFRREAKMVIGILLQSGIDPRSENNSHQSVLTMCQNIKVRFDKNISILRKEFQEAPAAGNATDAEIFRLNELAGNGFASNADIENLIQHIQNIKKAGRLSKREIGYALTAVEPYSKHFEDLSELIEGAVKKWEKWDRANLLPPPAVIFSEEKHRGVVALDAFEELQLEPSTLRKRKPTSVF